MTDPARQPRTTRSLQLPALRSLLRVLAAVCLSLWVAVPAWAANARLQLDAAELEVGQTGRLVVYVVDGRTRGAPQLKVPSGLEVRYYGSSQHFQADNFGRSLVHIYEYRLTALLDGTYTLGDYDLQLVDGTTVRTNQATLKVRPRTASPDGSDLTFEAGFVAGPEKSVVERVWEGQVVTYRYHLVAEVPIENVEWRMPPFDGLRAPQHGSPEERTFFLDEADGSQVTHVVGAMPLIATGTGKRDQTPALAQVRVPQGRADILGFRRSKVETLASAPAPLDVRPLPPAPSGFNGLVGDFQVMAVLDREAAAVGESVGWRLVIAGNGALEGWSPPELAVDGASVYAKDAVIHADVQEAVYSARGAFDRVVVPTREGTLQLPPIEVVTFSPTRGEYVTHRVDVAAVNVTAGREQTTRVESFGGTTPDLPAEQVEVDFRDIYTWGPARIPALDGLLGALSAVAALPGLLVGLGAVGERARSWRDARREARKAPVKPAALLRDLPTEPAARWAALDDALRLALARRVGVDPAALDRGAALAQLPEALAERIVALGGALDRARFAGVSPAGDLEAEVRALVDALEPK